MWEQSAIIAVGDEVLTGDIINTNAAWLAQELNRQGSRPIVQAVVGDDRDAIHQALDRAWESADLVVLVGGLGPTPDDVTREGVADCLGLSMAEDASIAAHIAARHRKTPGSVDSIHQQSQRIMGAEILPNPVGTAPGQLCSRGRQAVVLLPGPPAECRAVAAALWPRVALATGRRIVRHTWRCYDLTESEVAHHAAWAFRQELPRAGVYARPGVIELRLEAPVDAREPETFLPDSLLTTIAGVRRAVPAPLYDEAEWPTTPEALIHALSEAGRTLALAESLTGGLLAAELTAIPGASRVVMEATVVYTDAAKLRLGCPQAVLDTYGAVSREAAEALAEAARNRAHADFGIGLTGYAGPDGGTSEDPVGTYYCAVVGPDGRSVRRRRTGMGRHGVRQAACETARFLIATGLKANWDTKEQR